jgi:hypothetical protein
MTATSVKSQLMFDAMLDVEPKEPFEQILTPGSDSAAPRRSQGVFSSFLLSV